MTEPTSRNTLRLEAFSDGVFAIAITLLVLELRVPEDGHLAKELLKLWPSYLAFGLSFATILIMWTNHHTQLAHVHQADARLLFANGGLLLFITFIPFPTAVLGQSLGGEGAQVAAAFYAGTFVAINLSWFVLWGRIKACHREGGTSLTQMELRLVDRALFAGLVGYAVATGLAFISAAASVTLVLLLAAFWTYMALRTHEEHA